MSDCGENLRGVLVAGQFQRLDGVARLYGIPPLKKAGSQTSFDAAHAAYRNGVGSITYVTVAEIQLRQGATPPPMPIAARDRGRHGRFLYRWSRRGPGITVTPPHEAKLHPTAVVTVNLSRSDDLSDYLNAIEIAIISR